MLAIPTTAGTGSESTHFSVVYINGVKHSIAHDSMLPESVILLPKALETLPPYQKKAALLDAVCHGIESMWSVRADEESRDHAEAGLRKLIPNISGYLAGDPECAGTVMLGANDCGRAINLSQTTAAHAMCYSLTKELQIAHGHAAAMCLRVLLPFMLERFEKEGPDAFAPAFPEALRRLESVFGVTTHAELSDRICACLQLPEMSGTREVRCDADALAAAVNVQRLQNHPMSLTHEDLRSLYDEILSSLPRGS